VNDRFDLTGRTALVTGGSRGLGRAIAQALAEAGADVVIVGRNAESATAAAEEIHETTGRRAVAIPSHVGRWTELEQLVDDAYARLGPVDVLVNNAGKSPTYPSILDITEELFDSVLALNLKGPFRLSALVGSRMAAAKGGSIINVSTTGSLHPSPGIIPYAAAKAGLNCVTMALASALGPSVRVNTLMPGPFQTDVTAGWSEEMTETFKSKRILGRFGEPVEIAGAALFLASEASSYITGTVVRVDGGDL